MKKIIAGLILSLLSLSLFAQESCMQFLDIPIKGKPVEFVRSLQEQCGFSEFRDEKGDLFYKGFFCGELVTVSLTSGSYKELSSILVKFPKRDKKEVKEEYNKICIGLYCNEKYFPLDRNCIIATEENIALGIKKNNSYIANFGYLKKRYWSQQERECVYEALNLDNNNPAQKDAFQNACREYFEGKGITNNAYEWVMHYNTFLMQINTFFEGEVKLYIEGIGRNYRVCISYITPNTSTWDDL